MIDFGTLTTTRAEVLTIGQIAARAVAERLTYHAHKMDLMMDLEAVHATTPLRLADLLAADRENFSHDICGIQCNIDRETGELQNCFLPRYAK